MKVAVVLSGGGSNGAYQIGVWKALRKLKIKYDIVAGTSVGAINGALMTQKTFYKAEYFWKRLDFSMLFNEKLENNYDTKEGKKEVLKMYTKNILLEGGMEVSKLENLIRQVIKPNKIYESNIDYGLVTFKLSKFIEVKIFELFLNSSISLKSSLCALLNEFTNKKSKTIDAGFCFSKY